jgi:hypothetical protein
VRGPLPLDLIGILAAVADPLADAGGSASSPSRPTTPTMCW